MAQQQQYIQAELANYFESQARKVWFGALAIAAAWVGLILLPPIAGAAGLEVLSDSFYRAFSFICHQIPERSFHIYEHKFAVCSRCFGVYFGIFAGFAVYPIFRRVDDIEPLPRFWLFAAMFPIGIDWTLGIFGIWDNNFLTRFATGLILGAACAFYMVPAVVEIFRLTTGKRKRPSR